MKIEFEDNVRRLSSEVSGYRVPEGEVKVSTNTKVTLSYDEMRQALIAYINENADSLEEEVPDDAKMTFDGNSSVICWTAEKVS